MSTYNVFERLTTAQKLDAMAILQDCLDNGRVESFGDGELNRDSVQAEVSFEAGERGYNAETAELMGDFAADQA